MRLVDEVSGAVFEQETTADLPANTQFLAPRLFMNNGAIAATVAHDCSGVFLQADLLQRTHRKLQLAQAKPNLVFDHLKIDFCI